MLAAVRMLLPDRVDDLGPAQLAAAYAWPSTPWLRANMVSTVDGVARSPDGLTAGISSTADKQLFMILRDRADAIIVGAGTVRAESYGPPRSADPAARAAAGQQAAPVAVVLTRSGRLDPAASLFSNPERRPIVVTVEAAAATARSRLDAVAEVVVFGRTTVDLAATVAFLHERGLTRLLTEGGPVLLADLVAENLVDELCVSISPLVAGGSYPEGQATERILSGRILPDSPRTAVLTGLCEQDGSLFCRYRLRH